MPTPAGPAADSELLGSVIEGRYRLVERLGGGAVAEVFRAEDLSGAAAVAVKVWHASVLDTQAAGRFHRETKALLTLEHPRIVAIRDYGMLEGSPYLVMELLHGEALETRLGRGRLPADEALAIVRQLLEALAYAHEHNVVHRDLKPENVFLLADSEGALRVKVLDYGLAKFLQAEDDPMPGAVLTRRGMMVGTPLYVAPEQALGGAIDVRADVYSVGCMLFELLSGQPPFLAESLTELLRAHLVAPIPQLSAFAPELARGAALQAVIERAMAKTPAERFANAGEMLHALEQAVAGVEAAGLAASAKAGGAGSAGARAPTATPATGAAGAAKEEAGAAEAGAPAAPVPGSSRALLVSFVLVLAGVVLLFWLAR